MSCLDMRIRLDLSSTLLLEGDTFELQLESFSVPLKVTCHNKGGILKIDPDRYLPEVRKHFPTAQAIPCGKCQGCRMDQRLNNTARMYCEAVTANEKLPHSVWFLTLTYDEEHLPAPKLRMTADSNGEVFADEYPSLQYDDVVAFDKRLRDHFGRFAQSEGLDPTLRVVYCGEYGGKKGRPHYHLIIFGCPETFWLKEQKRRIVLDARHDQYHSFLLDRIWGKGRASYCEASFYCMQYLAGYVLKKMVSDNRLDQALLYYAHFEKPIEHELYRGRYRVKYPDELIDPERRTMPRRPGLGREFYEKHKFEIYREYSDRERSEAGIDNVCRDYFIMVKGDEVYQARPPAYFDRLFHSEDPDRIDRLKEYRREYSYAKRRRLLATVPVSVLHEREAASIKARYSVGVLTRKIRDF